MITTTTRLGQHLAQAPQTDTASNRWLNIGIFAVFVLVTLVIVFRASRNTRTASDYYAAGRAFTGPQNGIAISGDYLSAASFLGIAGAIAVYGYDGFLYSIGFLVAWLVALLLVAELLRNTGKYTMADVLSFRMRERPVRTAASLSTLAVSFFYLLAQMAGAGGLIALLLGISDKGQQAIVIAVVGALMIIYVLVGGMKGTTWVQIIKAALLIAGTFVMTLWVLGMYGFNLSSLLGSAVDAAGPGGEKLLNPGAQYGKSEASRLDFISLGLALVLGTAGLPHVLMRFYTVPTAKEARRSVVWAIWLIGLFYLFTLVLGYGAGALVRLDHFNQVTPDVPRACRYMEGLGFRITEDISDAEGTEYAAWMRRKSTVHDTAMTGGNGPRMHHVAFATHEKHNILYICDKMGALRLSDRIERGPGRHGVSNAFYLYILDPDDHRIEIYTQDYYTGDPDNPVVTWDVHDNQRRDWWGNPVVPSWYTEASPVLDLDGAPQPVQERTDSSEMAVTVGADGFSYTRQGDSEAGFKLGTSL